MTKRPTHDTWGKPIWYPDEKPYRVTSTLRTAASGLHGWRSGVCQTFATEEEARAYAATITVYLDLDIHKARLCPGPRGFNGWDKVTGWTKRKSRRPRGA